MNAHDYVAGYEFRSDDGDHTPTDSERAMIEDAIEGYLATLTPAICEASENKGGGAS